MGMKGDRVEIVVDTGSDTRTYEIEATRVLAIVEHPAPRPARPDDERVTSLRAPA
jgi:hypothetical protein